MSHAKVGSVPHARDVGEHQHTSALICRADAQVSEALSAILIGLLSVEGQRSAITPLIASQIERLACTEAEAARLVVMILGQFVQNRD
jgi:VIT1/CCC1 family predicted Fe2+/Mn2+ transporter